MTIIFWSQNIFIKIFMFFHLYKIYSIFDRFRLVIYIVQIFGLDQNTGVNFIILIMLIYLGHYDSIDFQNMNKILQDKTINTIKANQPK